MKEKLLVSACLLGARVRYDGGAKTIESDLLQRWIDEGRVVSVCPELEGGLPVPRPAAEIQIGTGRVHTRSGEDVTEAFERGARRALDLVRTHGIRVAVLKARSPSCGTGSVYDGTFTGTTRPGDGVTAALLRASGVAVFTEDELAAAEAELAAGGVPETRS